MFVKMVLQRILLYVLILFGNSNGETDILSDTDDNNNVSDYWNNTGQAVENVPDFMKGGGFERDDIHNILQQEEAQEFLQAFNPTQQAIVYEYILNCPYNRLCEFDLDLGIQDANAVPCCDNCLCNYPECMKNRSCCPDILPSELFTILEIDEFTNGPQPDHNNSTFPVVGTNSSTTDLAKTIVKGIGDLYKSYRTVQLECTLEHAKLMPNAEIEQTSSLMFATCPPFTDDSVKAKCEQEYTFNNINSVDDMVPVTVNGHAYRNKYCLECFGLTPDMYALVWKIRLTNIYKSHPIATTDESVFLQDFFSTQDFDLQFVEHVSYTSPHGCKTLVSECNKTGLWVNYDSSLVVRCALYANAIRLLSNERTVYQNVYCALCNGEKISSATTCSRNQFAEAESFPFSGLLALSPSYVEPGRDPAIPVPHDCERSDQVYDEIQGQCVSIQCSKFHYLTDGECQRLFSEVDSAFYYHIQLLLTPTTRVKLIDVFPHMSQLRNVLYRLLDDGEYTKFIQTCYILIYFTLRDSYGRIADVGVFESYIQHVHFLFRYGVKQIHDPYITADIYSALNGDVAEIQTAEGTVSFTIVALEELDPPFPLTDFSVDSSSLTQSGFIFSWQARMSELIGKAKFDDNLRIILPYSTDFNTAICPYGSQDHSIGFVSITDCPVVKLSKAETGWNIIGGNIRVDDYNFTIEVGDYYFETSSTLQVCLYAYFDMLNSTRNKAIPEAISEVTLEGTLSIACVSISILCLVITITVFVSLPSLRTLPGMNTLALSMCLLFTQSLYLVSSFGRLEKKSLSCIMVGVLLHFFGLLSIFWMSICTFNMFRVLTRTKVASAEFGRKYAFFHLFATLMSISFVAACVAVSMHLSGGSDLGYGTNTCYFSSVHMLRFTFVLPVFAVVISNFIMFIVVILKLERSPKYIRSTSNRNEFLIFIKLSSLTGVTWIFGVLYSWFDNVIALSYIFIILNASQGMFIMISFVFNERVLRMSRDKFRSSLISSFRNSSVRRRTNHPSTMSTNQSYKDRSDAKENEINACNEGSNPSDETNTDNNGTVVSNGGGKLTSDQFDMDNLQTDKHDEHKEDTDTSLDASNTDKLPNKISDADDTIAKVDEVCVTVEENGSCVKDTADVD